MIRPFAPGVFVQQEKRRTYLTLNLAPGKRVYGEYLYTENGQEYRSWDPLSSKLCAALVKGITCLPSPGDAVLYLGASTGTTVSHVSDIAGSEGIVFAVEFAPRVCRELVFLARERSNIAPLLADASQPLLYEQRICQVDYLFQDVAQRNQVSIFLRNVDLFLKPQGLCVLAIKARSIDSTKKPTAVFGQVKHELSNSNIVQVINQTPLEPFQKDHMLFVCKKI